MIFEFNTDLLLDERDRDAAQVRFPGVYFALDHDKLRAKFDDLDKTANLAKQRSWRWGVLAVVLGTGSLMIASGEPLYAHLPPESVHLIAAAGAGAGVLGAAIGLLGVMFHTRKVRWLQCRLATERLRQYHFQSMVARIPELLVATTDMKARERYLAEREAHFQWFERDFLALADAHMPREGEHDAPGPAWLVSTSTKPLDCGHPLMEQLLESYETLRFKRQIQYANVKLTGHDRPWLQAAEHQAMLFSGIALGAVVLIVLVHAAVLWGTAAGIAWMTSPAMHVGAIWTAIVALAARAFEEGLQPGREVERLRHYLSTVRLIHQRFQEATTVADKAAAMREMEQASYREMDQFLRSAMEAKFVL